MEQVHPDRSFWAELLRRVGRRTGTRGDAAEELLHAAYVRVKSYQADKEIENPSAYLVQTAANIAIDTHRRDRHRSPDGMAILEGRADHSPLQDEVIAARNRLARVREGLAQLPPRTQEIFLMHRIQDMKYREIARAVGISQSAVEKHIARAAVFLAEWTKGW